MAYDEGHAALMRDAIGDMKGIVEKKMFGGLCFMLNGNMLCGVHKGGGMYRVGKGNEAAALAVNGVSPLAFTSKKMGGMLDVNAGLLADDDRNKQVLDLALDFVGALPAK